MGLPFVVGTGIALATGTLLAGNETTRISHALFFGLAMAITALPVLARILVDLDIQVTRVGALSLSSAAIGDGLAWLTLAVILASAGTGGTSGGHAMVTAALALTLVLATWLCLRPALAWLVEHVRSEQALTVALVAGAIGYAALTQTIHLHPLIGAFLFGAAVPRDCAVVDRIREQLIGFTLMVLLPLFFAGVGLVTSVGLLGANVWHWLLFLGVLLAAQVTKFVGSGVAVRLVGLPHRESVQLGVLMNCRGITELVVATVGLQYGLVNGLGFTMLVLVAVITTALTGPVMRRLLPAEQPAGAAGSTAAAENRIEERTRL
jgi:Kef-type K+ transport system membrane component KefB